MVFKIIAIIAILFVIIDLRITLKHIEASLSNVMMMVISKEGMEELGYALIDKDEDEDENI